jgi:glycopeptide antibiotics resistance protein
VSARPSSAVSSKPSLFVLDPGLTRFAWVLLFYVLGLAGLATLSPFDFDLANPFHYTWVTTRTDVALNLAFLFPVGFLLRLARSERAWPWALDALALGVLVSCTLELTQLLLPSRCTSPTDVITNGLGAWAGGAAHIRIGRYLDRRLQRQLSLHLPLANLLYLSFPLLALEGLSTASWDGCLPVLAFTLFVAEIAAGLYKHRLEGTGKPFANAFSCAIGLSFGIAYMPIVVSSLPIWLGSAAFAGLSTRFVITFGTKLPATERRFVPATIKRAAPFLLLYVLLLGAHGFLASHWHLDHVLGRSMVHGGQVFAMALLRDVTAPNHRAGARGRRACRRARRRSALADNRHDHYQPYRIDDVGCPGRGSDPPRATAPRAELESQFAPPTRVAIATPPRNRSGRSETFLASGALFFRYAGSLLCPRGGTPGGGIPENRSNLIDLLPCA